MTRRSTGASAIAQEGDEEKDRGNARLFREVGHLSISGVRLASDDTYIRLHDGEAGSPRAAFSLTPDELRALGDVINRIATSSSDSEIAEAPVERGVTP